MWRPTYSNCNVWAWEQFRRGQTHEMTLKHTAFSKWARYAKTRAWQVTITPIGYALGYVSWGLVQICWFMIWGRWAHVTTATHEYIPLSAKRAHWFPPLIFKGRVQDIERPES